MTISSNKNVHIYQTILQLIVCALHVSNKFNYYLSIGPVVSQWLISVFTQEIFFMQKGSEKQGRGLHIGTLSILVTSYRAKNVQVAVNLLQVSCPAVIKPILGKYFVLQDEVDLRTKWIREPPHEMNPGWVVGGWHGWYSLHHACFVFKRTGSTLSCKTKYLPNIGIRLHHLFQLGDNKSAASCQQTLC